MPVMEHGDALRSSEVLVVGGGIIGLSIARQLAVRGVNVILLEQTRVGSGASHAAAGMLAAQVETEEDGPFFDLQIASRSLWQEWADILPEESGIELGYRKEGIYRIAETPQEAEKLQARLVWQKRKGLSGEWLDAQSLSALVSGLNEAVYGALYIPDDHQVDAVQAVQALRRSARLHGVQVVEGTPVTALLNEGSRVYGVRTLDGTVTAERVVLAGGMSVSALIAPLGVKLPLEPVRGIVCALYPEEPWKQRTLFGTGWYLTPKADGRLIVGATEEVGVNTNAVPAGSLVAILERAGKMVSKVRHLPFHSAWSGIRTRTPDALPVLGPVPGIDGLFVATGHFRNGILLAPISGEVMASWILKQSPAVGTHFLPERCLEKIA